MPTAANMVYMPNSSPAPNMVYMPNSSPPVHVATLQPEVGFNTFASRPSVPVKVSQYGNLTVGNAGSGSQFSQPVCIKIFTDILSLVCISMFLWNTGTVKKHLLRNSFLSFFRFLWRQIVGQLAHRTQPLQYAAHYTPVLSEPAYLQSNSPAVSTQILCACTISLI